MVDMTLCQPSNCDRKEKCWRYTHDSKNVWWQSYADFSIAGPAKPSTNRRHLKDCEYFIQNNPSDKDRRK